MRLILLLSIVMLLTLAAGIVWPSGRAITSSGVVIVAQGSASTHTCVITISGSAKCWGENDYGQLGNGTTTNSSIPVDVCANASCDEPLSDVASITIGLSHTCAVTASGVVLCWGRNDNGQLGKGASIGLDPNPIPIKMSGFENGVVDVAAGFAHNCGLTTEGGVMCWGNNFHGQLGNGTISGFQATPVNVWQLGSGVAAIAVGDWHSCAITTSGIVKCWGENIQGQLGNGLTGINKTTPVRVTNLGGQVAGITLGRAHTCAGFQAGGVKCWGRNFEGQLGDGTTTSRTTPTEVCEEFDNVAEQCTKFLSGIASIAAGGDHTCASTQASTAKCWGLNDSGQLADGTTTNRSTQVNVCQMYDQAAGICLALQSGIAKISAGQGHTCAVIADGAVMCWGLNNSGQLADATTTNRTTATDVKGFGPKPTLTPTETLSPIPTSSLTAEPVGGIAKLPNVVGAPLHTSESSGVNIGLLAGIVAVVTAGTLALGGATWYARRDAHR